MLVYRVESRGGTGAYHLRCGVQTKDFDGRHPVLGDDLIIGHWWTKEFPCRQWYFCFETMEKLETWFGEYETAGFIQANKVYEEDNFIGIGTYDVSDEDVKNGEKQSVFIRDRAQKLSFMPFMEKELIVAK